MRKTTGKAPTRRKPSSSAASRTAKKKTSTAGNRSVQATAPVRSAMISVTARPAGAKARAAGTKGGRRAASAPKGVTKHVAEPATLSEITRSLGVSEAEIKRVRRILSKYGYINALEL